MCTTFTKSPQLISDVPLFSSLIHTELSYQPFPLKKRRVFFSFQRKFFRPPFSWEERRLKPDEWGVGVTGAADPYFSPWRLIKRRGQVSGVLNWPMRTDWYLLLLSSTFELYKRCLSSFLLHQWCPSAIPVSFIHLAECSDAQMLSPCVERLREKQQKVGQRGGTLTQQCWQGERGQTAHFFLFFLRACWKMERLCQHWRHAPQREQRQWY